MIAVIATDETLAAKLQRDARGSGYDADAFPYPVPDVRALARRSPQAVVLGLASWDDAAERLAASLLAPGVFLEATPIIAVVTEPVLRVLPPGLDFDEIATLPCSVTELEFRLKRALRRSRAQGDGDIVTIDDISLSLSGYEVRIKGTPAVLTLKEYELLRHLMTNRGRVFTREQLLDTIWGYDYYGGTRTVDVHIRRVRSKIGDIDETYIKTVRGIGYTFRAPDELRHRTDETSL